ncbi:GAF domain-containing sensor histidine kinase [Desulfosarcina widdelii]|uniref:GAF domain-containing sensor histidine kinase n=1 Tax=Desulfosarcina widdelii TaxID=947919 RepID=UPI001479653F|nr:GAF domain-containing sensor histidine kinase [Desulfosarcina widdelii]
MNFDSLFRIISDQIGKILAVQKCSIFLIDDTECNLCSFVSPDLAANQIQFPKDQGIAGWVYCNQTPQMVNDAYGDPRFNQWVDRKTGSRTVNLICVPLVGRQQLCIGTMQVLNKKNGDFTQEDVDILTYMASYVAIALENSFLVKELKATDRARQKAIHHLSHEMKTPLSILSAVLGRCAHLAHDHDLLHLDKTLQRGMRSIRRLADIQEKVGDIIGQKMAHCERQYVTIFQNLIDLIDEAGEDPTLNCEPISHHVIDRIRSILALGDAKVEKIQLDRFLKTTVHHIQTRIAHRSLNLTVNVEDDLLVNMDPTILRKICDGLLKNAVENTPDEGWIVLQVGQSDDQIVFAVRDHGVGITEEDQRHIFKGFFHTQATLEYRSGRPYAFNAGGAGMDLLRMRTFAERLGFTIAFTSRRCRFIAATTDRCPGNIRRCPHIQSAADCINSGGSTFTVTFPSKVSAFRGSPATAGRRWTCAGFHGLIGSGNVASRTETPSTVNRCWE